MNLELYGKYREFREVNMSKRLEKLVETGVDELFDKAEKRGISQGIIETAKSMLKEGLDFALVARITKLPKKQIMALR
jgi:predicted transposase/invertase (TIGR01784 family)